MKVNTPAAVNVKSAASVPPTVNVIDSFSTSVACMFPTAVLPSSTVNAGADVKGMIALFSYGFDFAVENFKITRNILKRRKEK